MDERPRGAAIFAQINVRLPAEIHERIEYARDRAKAAGRDVSKNAIVVAALDDALPRLPTPDAPAVGQVDR